MAVRIDCSPIPPNSVSVDSAPLIRPWLEDPDSQPIPIQPFFMVLTSHTGVALCRHTSPLVAAFAVSAARFEPDHLLRDFSPIDSVGSATFTIFTI